MVSSIIKEADREVAFNIKGISFIGQSKRLETEAVKPTVRCSSRRYCTDAKKSHRSSLYGIVTLLNKILKKK